MQRIRGMCGLLLTALKLNCFQRIIGSNDSQCPFDILHVTTAGHVTQSRDTVTATCMVHIQDKTMETQANKSNIHKQI